MDFNYSEKGWPKYARKRPKNPSKRVSYSNREKLFVFLKIAEFAHSRLFYLYLLRYSSDWSNSSSIGKLTSIAFQRYMIQIFLFTVSSIKLQSFLFSTSLGFSDFYLVTISVLWLPHLQMLWNFIRNSIFMSLTAPSSYFHLLSTKSSFSL